MNDKNRVHPFLGRKKNRLENIPWSVGNLGSDTFSNPIFQKVLQNEPSSLVIGVQGCYVVSDFFFCCRIRVKEHIFDYNYFLVTSILKQLFYYNQTQFLTIRQS
jgi:hypothetical protein